MNMIFFNTGSVEKLKSINKNRKIEIECGKIARELIDNYIKPAKILCIGIDPFNALRETGKKVEQSEIANVNIKKSYRGDIPVYYIPNPSKRNLGKYYKSEQKKQYQQYFEQELLSPLNQ